MSQKNWVSVAGMVDRAQGKGFRSGWLVLGALQLALVASACGQSAVAENLGSSGSAPAAAQSEREGSGHAYQMPVRVSRVFFENRIEGDIRLQGSTGGHGSAVQSPVYWQEFAPTDPAPAPSAATGPVLADFRDHEGCASFQDARGVSLCFRLMGDVSNVGLNEREMTLKQVGAWLDQELGEPCRGAQWDVKFVRATRSNEGRGVDRSFTVSYEAVPSAGAAEDCQQGPVNLDVTLRQI